jgi:hypothetical protein
MTPTIQAAVAREFGVRRNRRDAVVTDERLAIVERTWGQDIPYEAIHAELSATRGPLPITRQLISKWARRVGVTRHPEALKKQMVEIKRAIQPVFEPVAPPDRESILRRVATREWPFDRLVRLCDLWDAGHSVNEISNFLRATKNMASGKVHRLVHFNAIQGRPSPIKLAPTEKTGREKAPPAPRVTLPPLQRVEPTPVVAPKIVPRPMVFDFRSSRPVVPVIARPVVLLGSGKCQFPMWQNHERPTHKYCDARTPLGQPWCIDCRKVVYTRGTSREAAA